MALYTAKIFHDGIPQDNVAPGKKRVLCYAFEAPDSMVAEKAFRSLETQFQGQNFKLLTWGRTETRTPLFMGVLTEEI